MGLGFVAGVYCGVLKWPIRQSARRDGSHRKCVCQGSGARKGRACRIDVVMIGANWNLRWLAIAVTAVVLAAGVIVGGSRMFAQRAKSPELANATRDTSHFMPSEAEWASLATEPA